MSVHWAYVPVTNLSLFLPQVSEASMGTVALWEHTRLSVLSLFPLWFSCFCFFSLFFPLPPPLFLVPPLPLLHPLLVPRLLPPPLTPTPLFLLLCLVFLLHLGLLLPFFVSVSVLVHLIRSTFWPHSSSGFEYLFLSLLFCLSFLLHRFRSFRRSQKTGHAPATWRRGSVLQVLHPPPSPVPPSLHLVPSPP